MNAMLEPRMVAAKIHGFAFSPHGPSLPPERSTACSQGTLMETIDAVQSALGPEIPSAKSHSGNITAS
jgi:hypothetical protein